MPCLPCGGPECFVLSQFIIAFVSVVISVLVHVISPPTKGTSWVRNTKENKHCSNGDTRIKGRRQNESVFHVEKTVPLANVVVETIGNNKVQRVVVDCRWRNISWASEENRSVDFAHPVLGESFLDKESDNRCKKANKEKVHECIVAFPRTE